MERGAFYPPPSLPGVLWSWVGREGNMDGTQSMPRACVQSLSRVRLFCDPMDCSPPGCSVHEISQARILEWVATSFSRGSSWLRDRIHLQVDSLPLSHQGSPWQILNTKILSAEKAMAPHSSTLAWKIPWMEEPVRLQSMGSLRVRHDWATSLSLFTFHFHALEKDMATHSSVLAWRIPGTGEPGGLSSMGSHRVGHDWSDLA